MTKEEKLARKQQRKAEKVGFGKLLFVELQFLFRSIVHPDAWLCHVLLYRCTAACPCSGGHTVHGQQNF